MKNKHFYFILFLVVFLSSNSMGQDRIKLVEGAASLVSGEMDDGRRYNKFTRMPSKQLFFIQQDTKINCDTARLFKDQNIIKAIGRIRINNNDSIIITADSLVYDGNTKKARLRGNVVLTDDSVTLYTDHLDYDRNISLAYYFNQGKLIDPTNKLTSEKGYYLTNSKIMSFKDSVTLINPEYKLFTDTLVYNTLTKVASTYARTEVTSKNGNKVIAENSTYNTNLGQTQLGRGTIESADYILTGDHLFFDDLNNYYTAKKNVTMVSKENDIIITGDYAISRKSEGQTKVYERAIMMKIFERDTLFLSADTLISIEDDLPENKRLLAYKNVRIYKRDLQGIADSLAYFTSDSVMHFYDDPVLWTGYNQLEADSINVEIFNNTIDRMNLSYNSFVIQKDTLSEYNQIKGRKMIAFFEAEEIQQVNVYGNGESLYYALENDSSVMGLNKILCSNMLIKFKQNRVNDISFYTNPEANFYPPHEISESNMRLDGFTWRSDERPTKESVLNIERKIAPMEEPKKIKEMLVDTEPPIKKPIPKALSTDKIRSKPRISKESRTRLK